MRLPPSVTIPCLSFLAGQDLARAECVCRATYYPQPPSIDGMASDWDAMFMSACEAAARLSASESQKVSRLLRMA